MKYLLIFTLLLNACSPDPQRYIDLAEKALKAEDEDAAFTYYQKAYEESLGDIFFWQDRDDSWGHLTVSLDRKNALLVRSDEVTEFKLIKLPKETVWQETLPGNAVWTKISPTAKYIAFNQKIGDVCQLASAEIRNKEANLIDIALDCRHRPAVSDDGQLYYMKNGEIGIYHILDKKNEYPAYKKTPDIPFKKMPAFSWFHISNDGTPFMTYGLAGRYKLYNLETDLKLLGSELSSGAIYFIPNQKNLFVILGGAGNHRLAEVSGKEKNKIFQKYPKHIWDEITLLDRKNFYFLEYTELFLEKNKKQTILPFWSRDINLGVDGSLFFLSRIGTPMVFNGKMPKSTAKIYYQKGIELDKSK